MPKILLRRKQVEARVNLSRSELYRLIALGRFPRPVPLGERAVAWVSDEVDGWIEQRINARGPAGDTFAGPRRLPQKAINQ